MSAQIFGGRHIRWVTVVLAIMLLIPAVLTTRSAAAEAPANPAFERTWARTDQPVLSGQVARTWMWGPEAFTGAMQEPYQESPGGQRTVQYFDKTRMEINDPNGDQSTPFYVSNGLLVVEMVEGHFQIGHNAFDESPSPAAVNIVGDPAGEEGFSPTYADINRYGLRTQAPLSDESVITQRIDGNGVITDDPAMAVHNVTAAHRVQVPLIDHQVASVFFTFLNSQGLVYENGQYVTAPPL